MNKLVIVGNGFDLAHDLPTSYRNFLNSFWSKLKSEYSSTKYSSLLDVGALNTGFFDYGPINSYRDLISNLTAYCADYPDRRFDDKEIECHAVPVSKPNSIVFKFKSTFFKSINVKNSLQNWVDFENEYYLALKNIAKDNSKGTGDNKADNKERIQRLNREFLTVINLFENYLHQNILQKYHFDKNRIELDNLLDLFELKYRGLKKGSVNKHPYELEFMTEDHDFLFEIDQELKITKTKPGNLRTLFLNFNVTASLDMYIKLMNGNHNLNNYGEAHQIHIHGRIGNKESNPINFGFGDEMDEDYKLIENLGDNEYLENFKSFRYSQNSNYRNLLDFIDSEKFQVYTLGHACGLSDRTLLNTIFEHNYCRSIKVYFHEWEDEEGVRKDDFTNIVQNISRHFNDKKLMRSKIVNKTLCQPLPQEIRFQEKKEA